MRKLLFVLLLSTVCLAQSDRKKFFPLPAALAELPEASLAPELRAAIAPSIAASSCKPNGSEKYGIAQVDLQNGTRVTLVRIDEPCLCGPSGNCPIYAVEGNRLALLDANGFAYAVSPNPKGGTQDLLIASHTSANVTSLQRFRWKGSRFKLQDCEAAVRKDLATGTKWDPEELDTTTCDAIALK